MKIPPKVEELYILFTKSGELPAGVFWETTRWAKKQREQMCFQSVACKVLLWYQQEAPTADSYIGTSEVPSNLFKLRGCDVNMSNQPS